MDRTTISSFFALLRSGLRAEPISSEEGVEIFPEQLPRLVQLAKKYDLEHLFALGLRHNGLISQQIREAEKSILVAAFRQQRLQDAQNTVCAALEEAGIPFLPLKGAVLRDAYPEPWMRTSCDIDILVREEDAENAAAALVKNLGYTREGKSSHDISLRTPNHTHLELHYTLIEEGLANDAAQVLEHVWDTSRNCEGYLHRKKMTDEMFYFYHIAHMAKHLANGGCGIRPFLDLWIMDGMKGADRAKRDALLAQGGLLRFAEVARALSKAWFEQAPMTPVCQQLQTFVLRGGVYGSEENRVSVQQQKQGGKLRYVLSRVFLPYDVIKFYYPVLQKHPWLMPFIQVRRWCKLLFCGHTKRVLQELKYSGNISAEEARGTQDLLNNLGL